VPTLAQTGFAPVPAKKRSALPIRKPPALSPALFSDLIGKPFVDGGRGPANYDCVGLVIEVAKRLGKTLPDYLSSETEFHAQMAADGAALADLPRVGAATAGDIVLLRTGPAEHHVGVMVDRWRMIHAWKGIGVLVERINSPLWLRRILGFYSLGAAK
jgi:cell wall-associated NlpC family hydrolase